MGQFLTAEEVGEIMGYSASHSYSIIRELNSELKAKGYIIRTEGSRVSISLSVSSGSGRSSNGHHKTDNGLYKALQRAFRAAR